MRFQHEALASAAEAWAKARVPVHRLCSGTYLKSRQPAEALAKAGHSESAAADEESLFAFSQLN